MKKNELVRLLENLGMSPNKKLGQNFLLDENFLDYIIRDANVKPGDNVLEVGPGFGALTGRLLKSGARVVAIEFDRKISAWLREKLVPDGLTLIDGDACKVDIGSIFGKGVPFRLISNLPYSAGTVVVANMLELETPPADMFIMLQKEVGLRLAAKTDDDDYGSLSVRMQALYDVNVVKTIPPELFYPQPEIDSCIVRLKLKPSLPDIAFRKSFFKLVKAAFMHRRKKMFKQIATLFPKEKVEAAMLKLNISPDIRAEKVSVAEFLKLAELLAD